MSDKKDLKKEELKDVTGGINFGRQVNVDQDGLPTPIDANFKPEDVGDAMNGGEEIGPEVVPSMLK